jgi:valyl-tRNA synthetase
MEIEKVYEPQRFEPHWARWWVAEKLFHVEPDPGKPYFSLAIPPPNVTGSLHMGHMFEHAIIDAQIRWRRMTGVKTLWLPGTDHAGIATQIMVERQLDAEGLKRSDLGREKFEARVWQWKEEYGGRIVEQMQRVGVSCDWERARFTLDPGLSRAVREAFVRLYDKGLIYQADYIVNWCPRCQTALSDLEVEHEETQGHLWHIVYPVEGSSLKLVVATTRPETMLGDTAVAINPKDRRAPELKDKMVRLPLTDRLIPIVLDDMADPEFGSGAVKITPAHDPNDFEAGRRHSLPSIQVIDGNARMTPAAGAFAGLDRFAARKRVVAELQKLELLEKIEDYKLNVGKCHRCKTVVEPLVSKQWWMSTKPLAKPAIEAVEDGRIKFVPANWSKTYFEWMYNIRDWCISRQLWWGHRIPAWHCKNCAAITVARETPEVCSKCSSKEIVQETDVLDTWFSSGLWPFSTLGWPDETPDLKTFYPTSLLVTGFDIIFFWAARMIMFGMEMMGDVPFREVHIHGLVRDAERQKMSKTKGNTIDPLVINDKYGTDAVRFTLLGSAASGADIALSEDRLASERAFANKIWNASRLIFSRVDLTQIPDEPPIPQSLEDRWIRHQLNACAETANKAFENHRYHEAADALRHFFWDDLCDWYLELKKPHFEDNTPHLVDVYETSLRLLHPLMPFITEELWQRLKRPGKSIALAAFPVFDPAAEDKNAARDMGMLQSIITAARSLRADHKVEPKAELCGVLYTPGHAYHVAHAHLESIHQLAKVKLELKHQAAPKLEGAVKSTADFDLQLEMPRSEGSGEVSAEQRDKLKKEGEQLEKLIANCDRQLANESFTSKAPPKVIETLRQNKAEYEARLRKIRESLG